MASETTTTSVKVLRDFHQFSDITDKGMVEVPNHLVQPLASVGTIELPADFDKKQAAKEAK